MKPNRRLQWCLVTVLLAVVAATRTASTAPQAAEPEAARTLGIGFGLGRETGDLALPMKGENDFVDTMARGGGLSEMKRLTAQGVKVSSVFLSLQQMRETISTLKESGIQCAYLAYNPEQNQRIPRAELEDFVGSVKKAKALAVAYGAPLVVGPGMRFMMSREGDYAQAAPNADVWLIQSQCFQIDRDTSKRATPEEYRRNVQRIVNLIRQGNPKTKIWAQIIICPGARAGNDFSAEEIVRLARAIEDIVDAVRIYTAGAAKGTETLKEVIRLLRPAAPTPPATASPAPAAAAFPPCPPAGRGAGRANAAPR
jgi:hypothetical protein